jgi:hypothetical protein
VRTSYQEYGHTCLETLLQLGLTMMHGPHQTGQGGKEAGFRESTIKAMSYLFLVDILYHFKEVFYF